MNKFFNTVILVTVLAVFYVSQQIHLVEYSYKINSNTKQLCLLIDETERLGYNVASLKTPANLKRVLALNNVTLDAPARWHNIRLAEARIDKQVQVTYDNSFKIAARAMLNMLAPKAEAIAQELQHNRP